MRGSGAELGSFVLGIVLGGSLCFVLCLDAVKNSERTASNKTIYTDETQCVIAEKSACDNVLLDAYVKE